MAPDGDDTADGLHPGTAKATLGAHLARLSFEAFAPGRGDAVIFFHDVVANTM